MAKEDTTTSFQLTIKTDDAYVLKKIAEVVAKAKDTSMEATPIGCPPVTPPCPPASKSSQRVAANPNGPITPKQIDLMTKIIQWNKLNSQEILDGFHVSDFSELDQTQAEVFFTKYKRRNK